MRAVTPIEDRTLRFLARLTGARRALGVGTTTADFAFALAEAIGPGGIVAACEREPEAAAFAHARFEAGADDRARIDVWVGPPAETLAALAGAGESFDLVVLGADPPEYRSHLSAILDDGLLSPTGLLCAGAAAPDLTGAIAGDIRLERVVLGVADGLTLARWAR